MNLSLGISVGCKSTDCVKILYMVALPRGSTQMGFEKSLFYKLSQSSRNFKFKEWILLRAMSVESGN